MTEHSDDFVNEMVHNSRAADNLIYALNCRGPFRVFKDKLMKYPDIEKAWYSYE